MDTLKLNNREKGCFGGCLGLIFLYIILIFIGSLLPSGMPRNQESTAVQKARGIGLAFWQYAQDHAGKYPEGKTSTEIFQKLLDGGYLGTENGDDSDVLDQLYYPMPGKIKAAPGTKVLKPENICWDMTCCVDDQSPDQLPDIFLTGYRVTYRSGASAAPLSHPPRTWSDWWHGKNYPTTFIVIHYMGGLCRVLKASPDGTIPNFIPADFNPKGKTYRQLTPDGELPP